MKQYIENLYFSKAGNWNGTDTPIG